MRERDETDRLEETRRRRTAGMTLVEAAVAVTLIGIVGAGATILMLRSQRFIVDLDQQQRVDETGLRSLNRIVEEFRGVDPESILPFVLDNASTCSYQQIVGWSGYDPILGPVTSLAFNPVDGEAFNDFDDNGDGRVDEGALVYQENGQPAITLARDILDLRISDVDKGIEITIAVGVVNRHGELIRREYTQRVTFRNE